MKFPISVLPMLRVEHDTFVDLPSHIVVAENLPEGHSYQRLMKIFSVIGSVKTIRTCYPQASNGTTSVTNRPSKLDTLFSNKVQTKHAPGRGRKPGQDDDVNGEQEEDVSTTNQPLGKQVDEPSPSIEASSENMGEEVPNDKGSVMTKLGRGRGRNGGKGRGWGQYHHNNNNHHDHHHYRSGGGHAVGPPPSSHLVHTDQPAVSKQPPGPRMPDGTWGFAMGRGKTVPQSSSG